MCATCGCSGEVHAGAAHAHGSAHAHTHDHSHDPAPVAPRGTTVRLEQDVLGRNDGFARENRARLRERGLAALNLVSSPGAGKTTLLVRTIRDLSGRLSIGVIEGDQETSRDADRIRATGAPALQINTGTACHLDAHAVGHALGQLQVQRGGLVVIENVGNLICPALFDLGEQARVLVTPVTEGEDKPLKYPHMFRTADAVVLNKIDLLPHLEFDGAAFVRHLRDVNPRAVLFPVSATKGDGLDAWYAWLLEERPKSRSDGRTD